MAIIERRNQSKTGIAKVENVTIRMTTLERDAIVEYCYKIRKSVSAFAAPLLLYTIGRKDLLTKSEIEGVKALLKIS